MAQIGTDIVKAKEFLESGELIGLPTETVYGLAGNALNESSVMKIFATKNRPSFDPLILHISSINKLDEYITEFPQQLKVLAENFWPGSLTLLLNRNHLVPDITCSGLDRAAFRIPNQPYALDLLNKLDFPLAAPSANPFGYISPTSALHVDKQLGDKIPYIVDGGECSVGLESTIVGMEKDQVTIYRLGGIPLDKIEACVGKVRVMPHSSSNPEAPGMLKSHYAPLKKIVLGSIAENINRYQNQKVGVLSFDKFYEDVDNCMVLSPTANMNEAAVNLFSYLRALDESSVEVILTELVPEKGLGKAINDRLKRASVS